MIFPTESNINHLIDNKASFKIGARGIAVTCNYIPVRKKWNVTVGRASMSMDCDDISALDDADAWCLELYRGGELTATVDLSQYTNITVLDERIWKVVG